MQNSSKLMITNLKERELNGKKVFPLKYEEEIASVGKRTWFIFDSEEKDGLPVFANQPVNTVEPIILNPPRYFNKFPLTAGTEWEEESKTYSLQKIVPIMIRKSIVSTDETVTVPSGTTRHVICLSICNVFTRKNWNGGIMGTLLVLFGLVFCVFCIYIAIKQIEFILKAIPLYEKMVITQEKTVSVLKEINENISSKDLRKEWAL